MRYVRLSREARLLEYARSWEVAFGIGYRDSEMRRDLSEAEYEAFWKWHSGQTCAIARDTEEGLIYPLDWRQYARGGRPLD